MDDLLAAFFHEEGRLFDHVMPDIDDQIGGVNIAVQIIVIRQSRRAEEILRIFVHHALAHLGGEERQFDGFNEMRNGLTRMLAIGARADQQQRMLGGHDLFGGQIKHHIIRHRIIALMGRHQMGGCGFGGDVFGQFEQNSPRTLFFRQTEGLTHQRRDGIAADNLLGHFADRAEQADNIDNLELALFGFFDRLLTGDHDHRETAEMGVSRRGRKIGSARSECGHADTGFAGQAAIGGGHEGRALLVTCQDQPDRGAAQTVEQIKVFFARHCENIFNAFVFECFDKEIRGFNASGRQCGFMIRHETPLLTRERVQHAPACQILNSTLRESTEISNLGWKFVPLTPPPMGRGASAAAIFLSKNG